MSGFLDAVKAEEVKMCLKSATMTQEQKVVVLARLILVRLFRDAACPLDGLEVDAEAAGLSGRVALQLGKGVGGKGGLNVWRDKQKGVLLCKDNANICLSQMSADGFAKFCEEVNTDEDGVRGWYTALPSID